MITMKFGGTSVGDVERLREVVSIVRSHQNGKPVVVVASAMGGVTNTLLETANLAVQRETGRVKANIDALKDRHGQIVATLVSDSRRRQELARDHANMFDELTSLLQGVSLLRELSARSLDAIAAYGEILSCMQLAACLADAGVRSEYVDSRQLVRTDAHFGAAAVEFPFTCEKLRERLLPLIESGIVPVVTGFIGSTGDGLTTTIGRSGSDYTASIVGAALGSEEIWIWTDVDGVMTADPRYIRGAAVLPQISYREAAEMSYFGAKVIHPKTMLPAIEKQIPIRIKNTFNPAHPGTLISSAANSTSRVVKTVTSIDNLSLIAIEGNGMIGVPGVSARIFSALARIQVNVMMISQASSEHNVCLVIPRQDSARAVKELRAEFEIDIARKFIDDIRLHESVSIVAVVGEGMRGVKGVAGKTFTAVADAGVNVVAIAQGSSELNISFVVEESEARRAVQAIHDTNHLYSVSKN